MHCDGQVHWSCRGRRAGQRHKGFPRNVGGPVVSTDSAGRGNPREEQKPQAPDVARCVGGSEARVQRWYRQAKENEARREGRPGVAAP
jgi:hypothetical protein